MKKSKNVLHIILLFIITIFIVLTSYLKADFPDAGIEELLFYLSNGISHSDSSVFWVGFKICFIYIVLIFSLLLFIFHDLSFNHKFKIYPFQKIIKHRAVFTFVLVLFSLLIICYNMSLFTVAKNNFTHSNFIENNYVSIDKSKINFENKKNLVFIVVESLETTLMDKEHGGSFDENYIPELYELLNDEDSMTFYNKGNKVGMKMLSAANWTTASVIANTSAVPFKLSLFDNYTSSNFLNGVYTLYDLLFDNGYHNEAISSAYTSFGGINYYLNNHHVSNIIDAESLNKYGYKMKDDEKGPWGLNDNYLYELAKDRLNSLSKESEPFSLTLITIDTHFPDGYIGNYSLDSFKERYANSYATESKLLYDFVNWVKEQDFYKDTVIVIVGDHLSMQKNFFKDIDKNERFVYTCYVNAQIDALNNKDRVYTALDTYPSVVGAMGVSIPNNRIGLGSNIFSDTKTLSEVYGFDYLDNELLKKSSFYDSKLK